MLRPLTLLQPSCAPRLEKALLGCLKRDHVSLAKRVTVLVSSCMFHIPFSLAVFVVSALCVCSSWAAATRVTGLAPSPGWFVGVVFSSGEAVSGALHLERGGGIKPHVSLEAVLMGVSWPVCSISLSSAWASRTREW